MEILFEKETTIVIRPIETKTISKLTIDRVVDFTNEKKVIAFSNDIFNPIELWVGDEYTKIGQWTDDDVEKRIKEIFA